MRVLLAASLVLLSTACATTALPTDTAAVAARWQQAFVAYTAHTAVHPVDQPTSRARVSRVLTIDVAASPERVFAAWTNVSGHVQRHPLLRGVMTHARTVDDVSGIELHTFTAFEEVPLGPFVLPIETHASSRLDPIHHRFSTTTWDEPATITRQVVVVSARADGTSRVSETLDFESDPMLISTAVDNGIAAHRALMLALKADLEAAQ
jgi:hypothetical protein